MAANEIVFKVKVEKDGNLSVVAKQAEKAAKGTDQLTRSTDNLDKKRRLATAGFRKKKPFRALFESKANLPKGQ